MESSIVLRTVLDRNIFRTGHEEPRAEMACGSSFAYASPRVHGGDGRVYAAVRRAVLRDHQAAAQAELRPLARAAAAA
jgi:hypothetical protein